MSELTLDSVQHDFATWRASRTSKVGKIPNYLWDKVLVILDYYPVSEVTRALHLSGGQVSAKRKQREVKSKSLVNANFVELNMSPAMPSGIPLTNTYSRLEIRRPDGAVLAIDRLPEQAMLQVLNQFTRAVQ